MLILLVLTLSMLALVRPVLAEPSTWMEPQHPTDKDTVRFYCRAPGAYDVRFDICADNGTVCYLQSSHGKTDSDTWWVEVEHMDAGTRAHYEVNITYQNESTGNETYETLGPYHFTVGRSSSLDTTPFPGVLAVLSAICISAFIRRKMR